MIKHAGPEILKKKNKHLVTAMTPRCKPSSTWFKSDSTVFSLQVNNANRTVMWILKESEPCEFEWNKQDRFRVWWAYINLHLSAYQLRPVTTQAWTQLELMLEAWSLAHISTWVSDCKPLKSCQPCLASLFTEQSLEKLDDSFSFARINLLELADIQSLWWILTVSTVTGMLSRWASTSRTLFGQTYSCNSVSKETRTRLYDPKLQRSVWSAEPRSPNQASGNVEFSPESAETVDLCETWACF